MGWSPNHKRIREHYNPVMTAAEKEHALFVTEQPCFGCGSWPVQAHHTLLSFPEKRWRRDHSWLLAACAACHADIHDWYGDEAKWLESIGRTPEEAIAYMAELHEVRKQYG